MKIKLLTNDGEKININIDDQLEKKLKMIDEIINVDLNEKNIFQNVYEDDLNVQFNKKLLNKYMALLIDDLNLNLTYREIQNIVNKNNPVDQTQQKIINLYDALNMFWKPSKMIHENNIFMLYKIISSDLVDDFQNSFFRKQNDIHLLNKKTLIVDFNRIPTFINQLIEFINDQNSHISPFVDMQIINLNLLTIAPFENYNTLLSKIVPVWYLIKYKNKKYWKNFPIDTYLDVLHFNSYEYYETIEKCLRTNDYTDFINLTAEKFLNYQIKKNWTEEINFILNKRHIFLASHEKKFLFVIIYKNLNEFDWKKFKKIVKWNFSKQFIIRNLSVLEKYSLLSSVLLKNRKFFYQTKELKEFLRGFENNNYEHK